MKSNSFGWLRIVMILALFCSLMPDALAGLSNPAGFDPMSYFSRYPRDSRCANVDHNTRFVRDAKGRIFIEFPVPTGQAIPGGVQQTHNPPFFPIYTDIPLLPGEDFFRQWQASYPGELYEDYYLASVCHKPGANTDLSQRPFSRTLRISFEARSSRSGWSQREPPA